MKFYRQFLSLLLVCVLSLGVFSITASAEGVDNSNLKVNIYAYARYLNTSSVRNFGQLDLSIAGTTDEPIADYKADSIQTTANYSTVNYRQRLTFVDTTGKALFKSGENYTFTVDGLVLWYGIYGVTTIEGFGADVLHYQFVYSDGSKSSEISQGITLTNNTTLNTYSVDIKLTPEKDVFKLMIWVEKDIDIGSSNVGETVTFAHGYGTNETFTSSLSIDISKQSEEAGLLSGLINWVKSIFDKVGDIFDTVSSGFANIGTWFAELPGKLWAVISDGLKDLFVPDEEYMTDYSDKWDELLSQRFGAIYQVGTIISDFASRITSADETNSIDLPLVSLDSVGVPFSFGGYQVQIVPDGFTTIVEVLKKIISVVCTFLFINGLRKRYDEVMGVEQ